MATAPQSSRRGNRRLLFVGLILLLTLGGFRVLRTGALGESEAERAVRVYLSWHRRMERNQQGIFQRLQSWRGRREPLASLARWILGDETTGEDASEVVNLGSAVLPPLFRALRENRSPAVRAAAVKALAALEDPAVATALLQVLATEKEESVRLAIVSALGELEVASAVEPLTRILEQDPSLELRAQAARALHSIPGDASRQALERVLRSSAPNVVRNAVAQPFRWDRSEEIRETAMELIPKEQAPELLGCLVEIASRTPRARLLPLLLPLLDRAEFKTVRVQIVSALQTVNDPASLPRLRLLLEQDEDAAVRQAAVKALGQLGGGETAAPLAAALQHDPATEVRIAALSAFAQLQGDDSVPLLAERLQQEPSVAVRQRVVAILLGSSLPEARRALLQALNQDRSTEVRACVALGLGSAGEQELVPLAEALLFNHPSTPTLRYGSAYAGWSAGSEDTQGLRQRLLQAVAALRTEGSTKLLVRVLDEIQDYPLVQIAVRGLGAAGTPEARQALRDTLRQPRFPQTLSTVVEAIGRSRDAPSVPDLISLHQRAPDDGVRAAVTVALGAIGGSEATRHLVGQLATNTTASIRVAAVEGLSVCRPTNAVELILRALERDRATEVRVAAITALGQLHDPKAVPALRAASSRRELRSHVFVALADLGDAQTLPLLREGLQDPRKDVRMAAATALGDMVNGESQQLLAGLFQGDRDRQVRQAAVKALATQLDSRSRTVLEGALQDRDSQVRQEAALGLSLLGDWQSGPVLVKALADRDNGVRFAAAVALGTTSSTNQADALRAALTGKELMTRLGAACGLAFLGMNDGLSVLEEALRSDTDWHQLTAIIGIIQLGTREARARIGTAFRANDRGLQRLAERVRDGEGAGAVAALATQSDSSMSAYATRSLALLGDPAVVPALETLALHRDQEIRHAAHVTLRRLSRNRSH